MNAIKSRNYDLNDNIVNTSQPTELAIVLGSSSANRQNILNRLGWTYAVIIPNIDEKSIRNDDPYLLPTLIAKAKATAIFERLSNEKCGDSFVLLTADQIVLFSNEIREKPVDEEEAIRFLTSYSNQSVFTLSAVVATHYPSGIKCKLTYHFY
jgi:septum formation protein